MRTDQVGRIFRRRRDGMLLELRRDERAARSSAHRRRLVEERRELTHKSTKKKTGRVRRLKSQTFASRAGLAYFRFRACSVRMSLQKSPQGIP
jgi:hypothetical protein